MNNYKIEILYGSNDYLNLADAISPDGKRWTYAKRVNTKGVVIVVPLILDLEEPYTMFLKTKRPPLIAENISEFNLEFPAGLVADEDSNETFEDALNKELLEETGLMADKFVIKTDKLSSSAGCVSEVSTLAVAVINNSTQFREPVSDGGVIQERIIVPLSKIKDFIKSSQAKGWSVGAQTLAGIYYLYDEAGII